MTFDPNDPASLTDDEITRRALARGDDPNYWLGKRTEFGLKDPAYFWKRMSDPKGPPAGAASVNDPLVYKTLPQVSQPFRPLSYDGNPTLMPKSGIDTAPPESASYGAAGAAANLDPSAVRRAALVKMLRGG